MAIARQRLTLEEFLRLPEQKPALEYWHGEVSQKVSPTGPHSALQGGFVLRLGNVATTGRLVRVFPEARITFAGQSLMPDLAVYRRDHVPRDQAGQVAEDFVTPPDVAVEILSPGQSRRAQIERCRWYVEHGVPLAIFADPLRRSVRLFRPGADSGDLRGADVLDLSDVIAGLRLTVDDFFAPLAADWA